MSYKLMLCIGLLFVLSGCFDSRLTFTLNLDNPREIGKKLYVTHDGFSTVPSPGAVETRNYAIESMLIVEDGFGELFMPILFMPRYGFMGRPYLEPRTYNFWCKTISGDAIALKMNSRIKELIFLLRDSPTSEIKMYRIKVPDHDSTIVIPDLPRLDIASESIKEFVSQQIQIWKNKSDGK